jgi:hypothetical protein
VFGTIFATMLPAELASLLGGSGDFALTELAASGQVQIFDIPTNGGLYLLRAEKLSQTPSPVNAYH